MAMESDTMPFLLNDSNKTESRPKPGKYRDDEDVESASEPELRERFVKPRYSGWEILAFLLAGWGLISICMSTIRTVNHLTEPPLPDVYRPETLDAGLNLCDCGHTTEEALSRNCVYDSLSTAWLPPHCRDDELTAEFERAGPGPAGQWGYFADENGTISLSKNEIALLGETRGSFWSSREWHIAHCMFYWQKYNRMRNTNAVMEWRFDTLKHVKHCTKLVMSETPDYFFLIEVPVMMNSSIDEHAVSTKIGGMLSHAPGKEKTHGHGDEHGDEYEEDHGEGHAEEHEEKHEHGHEHK